MRTTFFFLAMLASIAATAQNMQITPISATYTSSPVIQFKVSWTGARGYRHNIKVWVFVDYRKIENNVPAGTWTRAAVTATPAVNSTPSTTTATLVSGNDNGFWLNGVDGDYSATLTVPLTLAAGVTQFNWCAYATDYPPNVVVHSTSSYTLRGSPPFVINGTTLPVGQTTFSGTITSFTDVTGAPGLFPAALNEKTNGMGCVAGLVENTASNNICINPSAVGCTNNTLNLGTVSFTAGTEIEIVGNGISQSWSRPVTATGCQKTTFDGGTYTNYQADCRTNPNYAGDYFSGCAVIRYASTLCPPPWRVPLASDYAGLLYALGKYPVSIESQNAVEDLVNRWGCELNGWCGPKGEIASYGTYGAYSTGATNGTQGADAGFTYMAYHRFAVTMDVSGGSYIAASSHANVLGCGLAVRCIRDN
ncbi:MAG: hypothetical protein LBF81_01770 [Prevotellaceae bacterium]|jgi:hypothetical protein|nr:hypothetical protein [Prevotellaceae bacterium]